jgi:pimeloyl-ACP methyl ester carboxylesterase
MGRRLKMMVLGLIALLARPVVAHPSGGSAGDPELSPYVRPGILADIGSGRRIHVLCMGHGSPTVILSAGLGNWAETWRKVQPGVSAKTRVCTWDRAGFGFSSPSPEPQDVAHTERDLELALRAAKIEGPLVLVGHSLGGLETLLFADRNRARVAGMVLEDPSFPGQFEAFRKRKALYAANMIDERAKWTEMDRCAEQAKAHRGDPAGMDAQCPPFPPTYPTALTEALRPSFADPARWRTRKSLSEQFERDSAIAINPARMYDSLPLIVLTAMQTNNAPGQATLLPPAAQADLDAWQREDWASAHDRLAALSTRGENRRQPDASHYIHLVKPQVVIAAINEVVDSARGGRRP